jgi:hypothetical protein
MEDPSVPVVPEEETTLPSGARLGKYQIVRLLGAGGMGAVYEAVHTEIGKRVAVKTLAPAVAAIPGARQRFLREAQLTSRLRHPHIVDLTDMGSEGRVAYLVMELLAGEDLAHRLERTGPMAPRELVDLMLPVCSALIEAHAAGIVHRDLKPQNIFLATGHRGVEPKVLDFGISKSSDSDVSALTSTGSVIGTPHYLAPEQVKDARSASAASDQYSIGVIFYRCLANKNPFEGDSIFAVLQAIVTEMPVPLRERRADLPEGLDRVVARAMNPLPWERFPSVRELGRALLPYASAKARVIWEEAFAAGAAVADPEPPRASHTMPMPTPTGRPARAAAEIAIAKARVDPGTLSPAVTSTDTSLGPGAAPRSRRGAVIAATLLGAAIAVGGFALLNRAPRAPYHAADSPSAPAAATTIPAPAPVTAPPPAAATVVGPPPPAEAPKEAAPATEAAPRPPKEVAPPREAQKAEAKEAPPAALTRRRPSGPARHGTSRAHPVAPGASPRSLNPNGAPVID